jgi:hypothetical protein
MRHHQNTNRRDSKRTYKAETLRRKQVRAIKYATPVERLGI